MIDIGHFALVAAWMLSLYGLGVGFIGAWKRKQALTDSAKNATLLVACFSIISFIALAVAFLNHDYRYLYVWQNSSNEMESYYLISAIWGGMDGSMLFWAVLATVFSAIAVFRTSAGQREMRAWLIPTLNGISNFYLVVVTFCTNPFRIIPGSVVPPNGNGLNPLLQNPSMLIHPVSLYLGFTGFAIPFAFCIAALCTGNLKDDWIRITRRWTLVAWGFLTAGIILGGNWAYIELGWGGFWAWDPVENASFLPWLTGTAYLHSVMVQQRRGTLKVWNVVLCSMTYLLTVFGTFLTRSGIVQSVHAFANTDVGWVFLLYIAISLVVITFLIWLRWSDLRPENRLESYLSREAMFLFNNLALIGICFATFWGVMFPVFSEAFTGEKSVVGPPFFNQVNVPIFLMLILLMGVGPLVAWRKSSKKALVKIFLKPLLGGSAITILFLALDPARLGAAVSFGLCTFVLITIFAEVHRAIRVRKELSAGSSGHHLAKLIVHQPQKYGGYLVHFGVLVMTVSITASMVYKLEQDFSVGVGEEFKIGRYDVRLERLEQERRSNHSALVASLGVFEQASGEFLGRLQPEQRFYFNSEQTTTEVDIRSTMLEDLYVALGGLDKFHENPDLKHARASFKVFVNPLQVWLWIGSFVVLIGTLIVLGVQVRVPSQQTRAASANPAEVST